MVKRFEDGPTRPVWKLALPSIVTGLRLVLLLPVLIVWFRGVLLPTLLLYGLILLSDAVDGWIARRTGSVTRFGTWFDPIVDIVVVLVLLGILAGRGSIPLWSAIPPVLVTGLFLAACGRRPRYGKLGKYYGTALYLIIGIALAGTRPPGELLLGIVIAVLSGITMVERIIGLRADC